MDLRNVPSHAPQRLTRSIDVEFAALRRFLEVLLPLRVHGNVCRARGFAEGGGMEQARVEAEADGAAEVVGAR